MSVYDNLLMGAYSRRKSRSSEIRRELALILELFPRIADELRQNAGTLSGGEQQMVAVGRALIGAAQADPELDEPSMGLAPSLAQKVYLNNGHIKALGTSMLIVEQNEQ